tara:strand:+ start:1046 stop:1249 length:204 start_codon:yes stop_codon:yes gene_type:complete
MKILSSSPYAAFNVKEWNSLTQNSRSNYQSNLYELRQKSSQNFKKYNSSKSLYESSKKATLIQLSFA